MAARELVKVENNSQERQCTALYDVRTTMTGKDTIFIILPLDIVGYV